MHLKSTKQTNLAQKESNSQPVGMTEPKPVSELLIMVFGSQICNCIGKTYMVSFNSVVLNPPAAFGV